MSRRYRACSARCAEILDNLKDAPQVEPAYLIYLHFYAAASMEMCTRPLPLTSPYRAALLQQARNHYDRANALINAAEDSVAVRTRCGSSASSSRTPSLHSPASSISSSASSSLSRAYETSGLHSPTSSVYSFDNEPCTPPPPHRRAAATPPKRVKKVSFSLPLSCAEEPEEKREQHPRKAAAVAEFRFPEPAIRPDSPTLGGFFDDAEDDEYFRAGAGLRDLPPPPPPPRSALRLQRRPSPPPPPPVVTELPLLPPLLPGKEAEDDDPLSSFRVERSVHRYNETLSALRAQLAGHSSNLGAQLVVAADLGGSRPSSPMSPAFSPPVSPGASPVRAAEKQARIERLRKNGWVRKRFDGRRYEELAREVLAELE